MGEVHYFRSCLEGLIQSCVWRAREGHCFFCYYYLYRMALLAGLDEAGYIPSAQERDGISTASAYGGRHIGAVMDSRKRL